MTIIYLQEYSGGTTSHEQRKVEGFVDDKEFANYYYPEALADLLKRRTYGDAIGQNRAVWAKIFEEGESIPTECYTMSYYTTHGFELELVTPGGKVFSDKYETEAELVKAMDKAFHEKQKLPKIASILASQ
jgi:hypothetical protein